MTGDILDDYERQRRAPTYRNVEAAAGLVVEDRSSGFIGDIVGVTAAAVAVRDRHGNVRQFTLKAGGFLIDGRPVTLTRPAPTRQTKRSTTASGSIVSGPATARTAAASRLWVEGIHDAELVEHVWGDDLRELGVVVEPMHGIDGIVEAVAEFGPGPTRKLGVLVDHLVVGSKERRITDRLTSPYVQVAGHPFVDVWEGVRPRCIGLDHWPAIPRGTPWKQGMCTALGVEIDGFWPRLRNSVASYADLQPELVGAVESLIDFVSTPIVDP